MLGGAMVGPAAFYLASTEPISWAVARTGLACFALDTMLRERLISAANSKPARTPTTRCSHAYSGCHHSAKVRAPFDCLFIGLRLAGWVCLKHGTIVVIWCAAATRSSARRRIRCPSSKRPIVPSQPARTRNTSQVGRASANPGRRVDGRSRLVGTRIRSTTDDPSRRRHQRALLLADVRARVEAGVEAVAGGESEQTGESSGAERRWSKQRSGRDRGVTSPFA